MMEKNEGKWKIKGSLFRKLEHFPLLLAMPLRCFYLLLVVHIVQIIHQQQQQQQDDKSRKTK